VVSQALGCRPVSSSDELSPKLNMLLRIFLPRPMPLRATLPGTRHSTAAAAEAAMHETRAQYAHKYNFGRTHSTSCVRRRALPEAAQPGGLSDIPTRAVIGRFALQALQHPNRALPLNFAAEVALKVPHFHCKAISAPVSTAELKLLAW
jgi:hypothetical protein